MTDWWDRAACRDLEPDMFFPGRGEPATDAKAVCATCPVVDACLKFALTTAQHHGVWGGKSEKERKRMRADSRAGRAEVLLVCAVCDERFTARTRGARYCSKGCRQRAYMLRQTVAS